MTAIRPIFDTALLRQRQTRASAGHPADFLLLRTVEDLAERLAAVRRRFERVADIGTPGGALARRLAAQMPGSLVVAIEPRAAKSGMVRGDPESLPLAPQSLDLAVSALSLQFANDLPGALIQIRRALKPDGLFLGALVGGRTLSELRAALTDAEAAVSGGISPRIAPFADVRDLGGLLQRAGFALPVVDSDVVTVRYGDLFGLMTDLRAMGATNPLAERSRRPARREMFLAAAARYAADFSDPDGRIRATFEIVSLSGWAAHESQQKPAPRGSGQISLAAALPDRSGGVP